MQAEQAINQPHQYLNPPKYLKILTAILVIMFPVGIFIMLSDLGKPYLWTTTIFLGLEAVIMFFVLSKEAGIFSSFLSAAIIMAASFLIEWCGVNTGFPFGSYVYTEILQPKLFGVPVAIAFAWFAVTSSISVFSRALFDNVSGFTIAFVSAVLIFATDVLLEPFAAFINSYWQWEGLKIPLQNFVAWFALGFIFSFVLHKLSKHRNPEQKTILIPAIIIIINLLNFSIVNMAHGYFILTLMGLIIFSFILIWAIYYLSCLKRADVHSKQTE